MSGKLDDRRGQVQLVCDEAKGVSLENMIENAKKNDLYNPDEIIMHVAPDFSEKKPEKDETDEGAEEAATEMMDSSANDADHTDKSSEPFIISLPSDCNQSILEKIKHLLLENKGDTPCEIHIRTNGSLKRIKVPFGINVSANLESEIERMIS